MEKNKNPMRASDIRNHNEKIILRILYNAGSRGASQSEVVNKTGLKAPTVLRFFLELEKDNYIYSLHQSETDSMHKQKGRPPVHYVLNKEKFYSIGIEFWAERLSIGLFDFQGQKIYQNVLSIAHRVSASYIADTIVAQIEQLLVKNSLSSDRILGVGIGAPGEVSIAQGSITSYFHIADMDNFPLREKISERIHIPVIINNNCSVIALSESRYGIAKECKTLFTFLLRTGINGTFVNRGNIYTSSNGTTIEAGHIPISLDGPLCDCGKKGCLEAWVLSARKNISEDIFNNAVDTASFVSFKEDIENIARYLYGAINIVDNIFKPNAYLIMSPSDKFAEVVVEKIREIDSRTANAFESKNVSFYSTSYQVDMALKGASDLVMDDFFTMNSEEL